MNKPTKEQQRLLWVLCGWAYVQSSDFTGFKWDKPNQPVLVTRQLEVSPDNLFEYVFPKLKELNLHVQFSVDYEMPNYGKPTTYNWSILRGSHVLLATTEGDDFTLGLFWVALETLEGIANGKY